jgi:uncharacterized protein (TIGR02646 family)
MRNIRKVASAAITQGLRKFKNYNDLDNSTKKQLRESLVKEQFHLCCYCMGRIEPTNEKTRIEHHKPQSLYPELTLDYENMLAACSNNHNRNDEESQLHCDESKGNVEISRNPAADNVEVLIEYKMDGRIFSKDDQFQYAIDKVLNLNSARLLNQRKSMIDSVQTSFNIDRPGKPLNQKQLQKYVEKWSTPNQEKLEPFCQVVIWYLQYRLKRLRS